ncbi:unnamed protein product [Orchesella dallaii]|uniref:Transmembrane protein n=1 Tax=Orchesella dallaii TaxID=48710 RepID=A0ABP1S336_9HEXA
MCYVTLRGLVYFGASIHVYHGIQLMLSMCYNLFSDGRDYYVSRVDIIFNWCFLVLGIFIFRGVEQQSKTFIRWPTVGFTLLLAARFIVELLKQYQWEREAIYQTLKSLGPFTYNNMSIDVDPLISAAVGIYIFILFVYNHSLEYSPDGHRHQDDLSGANGSLPFHNRTSSTTNNGPRNGGAEQRRNVCHRRNSSSGYPSDSSDTARLIPRTSSASGDANNNTNDALLINMGGNIESLTAVTTIPNPLYEYDQAIRLETRRPPPPRSQLIEQQHGQGSIQYKVESV